MLNPKLTLTLKENKFKSENSVCDFHTAACSNVNSYMTL